MVSRSSDRAVCNWFSTSAGVLSGAHRALLWCCTPTSDDDDIRLCGNQKRMGQQKRAALQILGILFLAVAAVLAMSFPPRFPPPLFSGQPVGVRSGRVEAAGCARRGTATALTHGAACLCQYPHHEAATNPRDGTPTEQQRRAAR